MTQGVGRWLKDGEMNGKEKCVECPNACLSINTSGMNTLTFWIVHNCEMLNPTGSSAVLVLICVIKGSLHSNTFICGGVTSRWNSGSQLCKMEVWHIFLIWSLFVLVILNYSKSLNITHAAKCPVWGTTFGYNVSLSDNLLNQPVEVIPRVWPQTSSKAATVDQKEVVTDTGSNHGTKTKPAYNLTITS